MNAPALGRRAFVKTALTAAGVPVVSPSWPARANPTILAGGA
ncbi:MAG: hypothetical protein ACRELZ_02255 [Candidatus Rokuibacteriota bacterium]